MNKHKKFCIRTDRKFKKILLLKKDAQLVINDKTRTKFKFLKTFLEDFVTGVSHRMIWTVLKNDSGHAALLTFNFFYKFETCMVISTSGRRRLFFKNRFCISASRTIHSTLNLQARHYRIINCYNIYICSFTQYYLSMFRIKKIESCLFLHSDLLWDVLKK